MKKIKVMGASSSDSVTRRRSTLADDIWYEIFLVVPLESLCRFRCVSKVWFLILSNPRFMKSWYKLNDCSLPWGLLTFVNSSEDQVKNLRRSFTIAYPDSHLLSHLVSHHQNGFAHSFLNSIFPNTDGEPRKKVYILGSNHGLVLCATSSFNQRSYYVCNPLTKKWVSLPPPPSPIRFLSTMTGFICSDEYDYVSYKVIICMPISVVVAKDFEVEIFSSDLGEWHIYHVSCPQYWHLSLFDNFVTHNNGFYYWMQKEYGNILTFSVNNGTSGNECKLINLPDRSIGDGCNYKNQYLGESEGSICYAKIKYTEKSLSVWVLQEDWYLLYKEIKFHDTVAEIISWLTGRATAVDFIREIKVLGFSPVNKNIVILGYDKYIWAYNTATKEYEQLRHPSDMVNDTSAAHLGALKFVLKPRPTILPPATWRGTLTLDVPI